MTKDEEIRRLEGLVDEAMDTIQQNAQAVHQGFHTDQVGSWIVCPKHSCNRAKKCSRSWRSKVTKR